MRATFYAILLRSSFALGSCITALRLIPDPSHLKHPGTWARVPFYTILLCFIFCLRFIYHSVEINTRPLSPKASGHVGTCAFLHHTVTFIFCHRFIYHSFDLYFPTSLTDNLSCDRIHFCVKFGSNYPIFYPTLHIMRSVFAHSTNAQIIGANFVILFIKKY